MKIKPYFLRILKCRLLQFLLGALRVNFNQYFILFKKRTAARMSPKGNLIVYS